MDIGELIKQDERQPIEFKESFSVKDEVIETLCAFGNSECGTALIRVSDSGIVVGTHTGKNTLENFANKLQRSTEPPLYVSLTSHNFGGKAVVAVSVKAPRLGDLYAFGKLFVRVGRESEMRQLESAFESALSGVLVHSL